MALPDHKASFEIDDIDSRIISLLRRDGRMPYRAMAQDLGLTETTVRARVRRLEESNMMKVVAVTDFEAAGYSMMLAIGIEVEGRSPSDVAEDLARIPEMFSITVVVGGHDIQTLAVSQDLDSLSELLGQRLANIPGVRRVLPSLAVDVLKNQPAWIPFHEEFAEADDE